MPVRQPDLARSEYRPSGARHDRDRSIACEKKLPRTGQRESLAAAIANRLPLARRNLYRLSVRTSCCGCDNPGSIHVEDIRAARVGPPVGIGFSGDRFLTLGACLL
jgi:hypothetical protein